MNEYTFIAMIYGEDFKVRFWDYSEEAAREEFNRCMKSGEILLHI